MKILPITDEKELLLRLRDGDAIAFEKLYHSYKDRIIGHLLFVFKLDEFARDLTQEIFISIWEKRKELNPEKSFKSFLYTVATNKAYDHFRKATHDRNRFKVLSSFIDQSSELVDEYILKKENVELVHKVLAVLPEQQRKIYHLAKIDGYSYEEISKLLGISKHTVNTHIKRANITLRNSIINKSELLGLFIGIVISSSPLKF